MVGAAEPLTHLGDLTVAEFLRDYWQKKPLLIRGALADIPTVDPNLLAGFALEEDVESRLVIETPSPSDELNSRWQVEHGPLSESQLTQLPDSHWTLLVQAVDQLLPEVQQLLHRFRFIPNWRVDDIMVSHAADGGGVGPHFDYYDVFLLQAEGRRRWRIGQQCSAASPLRTDVAQKLLTQFDTCADYIVEPGDLLYLPPRLAHWGTAIGSCTTLSVGFRAPGATEALLDFSEHLAAEVTDDERLSDPDLSERANCGLILPSDLQRAKRLLQRFIDDDQALQEWFGRYMTQPRRSSPCFEQDGRWPQLAPGCRAAYVPLDDHQARLFINGEAHTCSTALAESVCSYSKLVPKNYDQGDRRLIDLFLEKEWLL